MKLEPQDYEMIEPIIYKSITRCFEPKARDYSEKKIYNITQTAKIMGEAYNWVDTRMKDGRLATTEDGKYVTGKVIKLYRKNNPRT